MKPSGPLPARRQPEPLRRKRSAARVAVRYLIESDALGDRMIWEHPEFTRPVYYWNWEGVHNVTCIAEDSYGDQYPVSEAAAPEFAFANMTDVEDDALDRCYSESGQDSTCYLATCTHI